MKVNVLAFQPKEGATTTVTNATSATAAVILPKDCTEVFLSNSSSTATVFVRVTQYLTESSVPTGEAPTTTTDFPVFPLAQIRRGVGEGCKVIRTIASAADGNLYITPGTGV